MKELLPPAHFCRGKIAICGCCHSGTNECQREKSAFADLALD
ncbi:hypothetical protein HMPREF0880_03348 [Yokenella regensburgei ATCC 43003]|nr:hypothetical protein HMPREF0880_03348 [Yokenella regensburgei ATCC 43003]